MAKYQPQHMKSKNRVNLRGVAARSVTTVTLAAMLGGQLLSPVSAVAAQTDGEQGTHPAVTAGLNLQQDTEVDAKLAELQKALDEAQAAADAKAKELKEPQAAYEQKQQVVTEKQQAVTQAQQTSKAADDAALDQLTAEVEKAKAELAEYQAKIDAANKELDTAKADEKSKKDAAEAAKKAADKAAADLETAKKNAEGITDDTLAKAQKAYEDAKLALDTANEAVKAAETNKAAADKKVTDLTSQKATADAAAATAATNESTAASKESEAQNAYNAAQAAYDAIVEANNGELAPEQQEQLNQQIAAAKADVEAKKADYDKAVAADSAAKADAKAKQDAADALESQLTAAQDEKTKAQQAYDAAVEEHGEAADTVTSAQKAYDDAVKDEAGKLATYNDLQKKFEKADKDLDRLNEEAGKLQDAYMAAQKKAAEIEAQIEALQKHEYENNATIQKGVVGFLEYIRDSASFTEQQKESATQALSLLDSNGAMNWYDEYVDLNSASSPMSIGNLQNATTYMDAINSIRAANNQSELKVNLSTMVCSMLNACYTSNTGQHASNGDGGSYMEYSENMAPGMGGPYSGSSDVDLLRTQFRNWYTAEKKLWDKAVAENPSLSNMQVSDIANQYPDVYNEAGHYLNFVDSTVKSFGIAVGTGKSENGSAVPATIYQTSRNEGDFTVEQFRQLVKEYVNNAGGNSNQFDVLMKQAVQAGTDYMTYGNAAKDKWDEYDAVYDKWLVLKTDAPAAKQGYETAAQTTKTAKDALDKVLTEAGLGAQIVANALSKLNAAKDKAAGVQAEFDTANAAATAAQGKATEAANALKEADDAKKAAQATYEGLEAKDPTAAKEALGKADTALKVAKKAHTDATIAKTNADNEVTRLAGDLTTANAAVASAADELTKAKTAAGKAEDTRDEKKKAHDDMQAKQQTLTDATKADKDAKAAQKTAEDAAKAAIEAIPAKEQAVSEAKEAAKPFQAKVDELNAIDIEAAIEAGMVEGGSTELNAKVKVAHDARAKVAEAEEALTKAKAELGEVSPAYIETKAAYDKAVAERDAAEKALKDYMEEQKKPEQKPGESDGAAAGTVTGKDDVTGDGAGAGTVTGGSDAKQAALPKTGDASAAVIAVAAAAGLSMVGVAEALRRRHA